MLLVFPLYVDGIPAPLLRLLEAMERYAFRKKPTVHVVLNCGFLEAEQNQIASDQIRLFCRQERFSVWISAVDRRGRSDSRYPVLIFGKTKAEEAGVRRPAAGTRLPESDDAHS